MKSVQTIFFDESGYTGNNLLSANQPVFAYASVAIHPSDAENICKETIERFHIKGNELKGANLVRYPLGREAVTWVITQCRDISLIVVADKIFALSGKFFEYIFEPILQDNNSLFYAIGFHKFIANLIYIMFKANTEYVEHSLTEFESLMRSQDPSAFKRMLEPLGTGLTINDPFGSILTFAICHEKGILRELKSLPREDGIARWMLELTVTSLFWLLSSWSEQYEPIEVICDESKPLFENQDIFDAMVGRKDKIYMKLGAQKEVRLTYNLSGPIKFQNSKESAGIQIADIISSSVAFSLNNPHNRLAQQWLEMLSDRFSNFSISSDPKAIDLRERDPFINGAVLHELVDRTLKGKSLIYGMEEFVSTARKQYRLYPPEGSRVLN